ncbi:unnamed protein product [Orchesella dallaii]|uniref:BTB domain-containing protein n=1 Tax=Orchesella dallaii TaxID=48710 RepID=A0ABP1RPG0_9HEXA
MANNKNVNVRRITSKLLLRYSTVLEETGRSWKDVDWEEFELESGPGGSTENTTLKIINSCPVWKEVFEEQRKVVRKDKTTFCDVQIQGSDGYVLAHSIYLQHASGLVDSLLKSQFAGDHPSPQNLLGVTLSDVKVDHIRTVLSLLYCGVALVHQGNWDAVRYVMDALQMSNLVLEETPLSTGETGFQQVLIYRLRKSGGVNPETSVAEETPVSFHRGVYLPVLPLPPPPPPPIPSTSAASVIDNASIAMARDAIAASAAACPVKKRRSSQIAGEKRKKVTKAFVSGRYPKRSSQRLPVGAYKEVDLNDEHTSRVDQGKGVGGEGEKPIRKKIKTEPTEAKQENTSGDTDENEETKEESCKCYLCEAQFKTEEELEEHLEEKCGRILDGCYDLESRFCNACKTSFMNYDATEFIGHVGTCVNLMPKGKRRGQTTESLVYSDEDSEPAPTQMLEPSGEQQVTLVGEDEEGSESTPIVIRTVSIASATSISQVSQETASNSTVEGTESQNPEVPSLIPLRKTPIPLQGVEERAQQSNVVATVPPPKLQSRPSLPVRLNVSDTSNAPIKPKNFIKRKIIVDNNRLINITEKQKESPVPGSSQETAPTPIKRNIYVAPLAEARVKQPPPPSVAPPPINVMEEKKPKVYYGPGGKTITEIVVVKKHVCPRCYLSFQSESQLRSHMSEETC